MSEYVNRTIFNKMNEDQREKLNIILFLAGKLVSMLGTFIYSFAISLYVLKVTKSGTFFAMSVLMGMIPRIIFGPFAGSFADRIDRKKMVVTLDFLSGFVILGLAAISFTFGLKIIYIYVVNFVLAGINTFFDTSIRASVPNLVKDKNLMKINSYSESASSLSSIVSPILGGIVFGLIDIKIFLIINGISFILSAISEIFIDFNFSKSKCEIASNQEESKKNSILTDIKEVISFIKEHKALYSILKYALMINFFISSCYHIALPYIINNTLEMTSSQFGKIEGALSLGILIASIVIGKLPEKEKKHMSLFIGILMLGVLIICLGIPSMNQIKSLNINILFVYFLIVNFASGIFLIVVNIPLHVTLQRITPDELMGRVMGVLGTLAGGIAPLGIILAGLVIDITPPYLILYLSGTLIVLIAISMYRNQAMKEY